MIKEKKVSREELLDLLSKYFKKELKTTESKQKKD